MSSLDQRLSDFAGGRIAFEELTTTVRELARENAALSSQLMGVLAEARKASILDTDQYRELLALLVAADELQVTAAVNSGHTQAFSGYSDDDQPTTVGSGSIIKERFVLDGILGQGGMGVVYRARDLIKVEARDRNPFVAVKILNEDFKVHPESLIALQRECSKAQRLAHPNIATVYDFDRTGGMAYMTMEMLDGQPLNEYLATQLPDDGLSFADAWPIIRGMAKALGHAHRNAIVHSDFKPGNAFICSSGEVKVLDFGIARAVKQPGQADTTMFDAGSLGALTPAYASPEMLEGDEPDPRDDIYGLAVVSYILLTAQHPFDRYPANLAKGMKLKPAPVASLDRAQNAALARALSFERAERTPDIETFLAELGRDTTTEERLQRQNRLVVLLGGGLLVMAACVIYLLLR